MALDVVEVLITWGNRKYLYKGLFGLFTTDNRPVSKGRRSQEVD